MKIIIATGLFFSSLAFAETTTYDVKGMHCGACAKMIQSKVCALEGVQKCEVSMGKVVIEPKAGVKISQDQVQSKMSEAGEYTITGSKTQK